ncbi:capsid protein [Cherry-associated luteovirus]|nr:capsid protein [Cherry-associated luteovirus]APA23018.1 capsid protein [Cherry-associated luteovirus]
MPKGKKGKGKGRKGKKNGRNRAASVAKSVVVNVQPGRGGGTGRGNARGNRIPNPGPGDRLDRFTFTVDDLKANDSGTIKFGPSLSQYANFSNGILRSFHEYKITNLTVKFVSYASSTTSGAFAIEIDTSRKQSDIRSRIISFPVAKGFTRSFQSKVIRGLIWHPTTEDQFFLIYKGNGKAEIAGQFNISFTVNFQGPQ